MDQTKKERRVGPWVVLCQLETSKGNLAWAMMMGAETDIPATWATRPDFSDERVKLFSKIKGLRAGTVITLDSTADGSEVNPNSMRFVRDLPEPYATSWAILSDMIVDARRLKAHNKKAKGRDLPFEVLEPWRKLFQGTYGETRIALIARLLNYVERGVK